MVGTGYPVPGIFPKFLVLPKFLVGARYLMHRYLYMLSIKRIKPKKSAKPKISAKSANSLPPPLTANRVELTTLDSKLDYLLKKVCPDGDWAGYQMQMSSSPQATHQASRQHYTSPGHH